MSTPNPSPRYALAADAHFRSKDLAAAEAQFRAMTRECSARGVDTVLFAGDLFDSPNIKDGAAPTGEIVRAVMGAICDSGLRWYILRGNHDYAGAGAADALEIFRGLPNVTVIREPQWFPLPGADVFCLPWNWAENNAEETLTTARGEGFLGDRPTLLLHHMQISGMVMNGSQTCEHLKFGVTREFLEGLPFTAIKGGDFHRRQDHYIGALRQLNHGESGNPAGLEIWTPETNESEWIELHEAPRYETMTMTEPGELPRERPANVNLRVVCQGWRPSAAAIGEATAAGIKVDSKPERRERIARGAPIPEGANTSPLALLDLWLAEQRAIGPDGAAALKAELESFLRGAVAELAAPAPVESNLQEAFA